MENRELAVYRDNEQGKPNLFLSVNGDILSESKSAMVEHFFQSSYWEKLFTFVGLR